MKVSITLKKLLEEGVFDMNQNTTNSLNNIKRARLFWEEKLSGEYDEDLLPADDIKDPEYARSSYNIKLSGDLTEKLLEIGKNNYMSLYAILLTGLKVLLYKCTGRNDITVGAPVYLESEFNRFIPMKDNISSGMTFKEAMIDIGKTILDGYKYQFYPLSKICSNMQTDKLIKYFAKVILVLENIHDFSKVSDIAYSSENDLTIVCKNDGCQLSLNVIYNSKVLSETTVKSLIKGFERVLYHMSRNLDERIADFCIGDIEKKGILYSFNDSKKEYPEAKTIHELFEEQVSLTPQAIAVKCNDLSITYKELNDKANVLAIILRSKGVSKDIPVAVLMERSIELMVAIMGILKAGGAFVPVDPEYPELRNRYIIEDSNSLILLTNGTLNFEFDFKGDVIDVSSITSQKAEVQKLQNDNDPNSLASIIYTPGSTDSPNGVMIEHKGLVNLCNFCRNNLAVGGNDRIVLFSTISFVDFLWEAFLSLLNGAELHIFSDGALYESNAFEQFINKNRITVMTVPSLYLANLIPSNVTSLRKLFITGAHPEPKLLAQWEGKAECISFFGTAETTVFAGIRRQSIIEGKPNSRVILEPIDNYRFYITDPDKQLQMVGLPGELCISGAGISRGYFGKPHLTNEKFIDNSFEPGQKLYKTGVLARAFPDGSVEIICRLDRQIEIRGYLVEPGEVEQQMLKHDFIHHVAVLGRKNKDGIRCLVAYYVSDIDIKPSALKKFLQNTLPYYMIPAFFVKVPAIPLAKNGKADQKLLPELPDDTLDREELCLPQSETEKNIAEIWKKILKLEYVSLRKSFTDLGGNSILLLKMVAELNKVYPNEISVSDIFSYPTIKQLAARIDQKIEDVISKYRNISHMAIKLPNDYFKARGNNIRDGITLSYSFTNDVCSNILKISRDLEVNELVVLLAAYLYTLSIVSSEKQIIIHTMSGNGGNVYPITTNLNDIKDFNELMKYLYQKFKIVENSDTYEIKNVNKIELKIDPVLVIPMFYNASMHIFQKELLEIYDIVMGVSVIDDEIKVLLRYDGLRMHNKKVNELFSIFINCVEEIVTRLS